MSARASISRGTHTTRCSCLSKCGDVAEGDDNPMAVCKGLPMPPREPLVEIVLTDRRTGEIV